MEIPVKARRRLQDAAVAWQESRDRDADRLQQHADLRRARMTCASSLRTPQKTQDWTQGMAMSPSGRFRVIEERNARIPVITREDIRWSTACAIIVITVVLLTAILLADAAGTGLSMRNISRLEIKIKAVSQKNERLRTEISANSGDISVCTEAVKLNLIASGGARTVSLSAPEGAMLTFADFTPETTSPGSTGGRLASILGD